MNKNDTIMSEMITILEEWENPHVRGEYSSPDWKLNHTAYNKAIRKIKTLASKLTTR